MATLCNGSILTIIHGYRYVFFRVCLEFHMHLTRYAKMQVAHAPGMPGAFSQPPASKETFPAFPAHAQPQFGVSDTSLMGHHLPLSQCRQKGVITIIIEDIFYVDEHGNVLPLTATLMHNYQAAVRNEKIHFRRKINFSSSTRWKW